MHSINKWEIIQRKLADQQVVFKQLKSTLAAAKQWVHQVINYCSVDSSPREIADQVPLRGVLPDQQINLS